MSAALKFQAHALSRHT
jgi:hypothetical protein